MKIVLSWIKEILIVFVIVTLLLNVISFIKKPDLSSTTLPTFETATISKKHISSKEYTNKPLLLHFWATWCPTCKLEASNIESLSKNYQVITIAVNSGTDEDISMFLKKNDLTYDVINDSTGEFAAKFSISSFPTTFIYDKNQEIKFSEVGYTSTLGLKLRMWLSN